MNVCDILFFDLHFSQSDTVQRTVDEVRKQYANIKQRGMPDILYFNTRIRKAFDSDM
jgi:hypothetical protein